MNKQREKQKQENQKLLKEIDALKNQIKVQNSLFLKTSKELEDQCNTTMNEAIKIHEKCDYKTHSKGLLRMHKESNPGIKQTFQNHMLGFEFDIERHTEILKTMEEEVDTIKCRQCEFKSCS